MLIPFGVHAPKVDPRAFVQESAQVIGDVVIGIGSSVWFNVVIRADVNPVHIGSRTNIQDNSTIHVAGGKWPTIIGDDVTVGHGVILHGCTIGNRCLIGMGAIVLDGVEIADDCMIAAGALVTPGMKVPARRLAVGSPARIMRILRPDELESIRQSAHNYIEHARHYTDNPVG
ncbi:MAG: gamma carbonic anhydrase family protein [Deltaproteobacteria bacterium]|nr:gamma carbonic anhydrase family protein [Deltaproteobacteria bacterium]